MRKLRSALADALLGLLLRLHRPPAIDDLPEWATAPCSRCGNDVPVPPGYGLAPCEQGTGSRENPSVHRWVWGESTGHSGEGHRRAVM